MAQGRRIAVLRLDEDQIAALFDRHFPAIHAYLRRRLPAESARELAAETFLIAYRRRGDFDGTKGDPLPWLFGIASNLVRGERRRERRELRAYGRTGVDPVVDDLGDLEQRLDVQADFKRVATAIADLPSQSREVLLLYAWADLSYEEISKALGINVGTVRSRLARCRGRLRDAFDAGPPTNELPSIEGGGDA